MSTLEELLIQNVRNNAYIYDKADRNFKNTHKRSDFWQSISVHLKTKYGMDISAVDIEKKWVSMRTQFSRQLRKKLQTSEAGYESSREWKYYKAMRFLIPYISRRRGGTLLSLLTPEQETQRIEEQTTCEQQEQSIIYQEHKLHEQEMCLSPPSSKDNPVLYERPLSVGSSSNSSSILTNPSAAMPEIDVFGEDLENEVIKIDSLLRKTVDSLGKVKVNPYTLAIDKALQLVPERRQIECLIEILQVIRTFQEK